MKLSGRVILVGLAAVFLLGLSRCGHPVLTDQVFSTGEIAWPADQPAGFRYEVEDTVSRYNVFIWFRHSVDYPFSNLYLFSDTHYPGGEVQRDTLQFILARKDGRWLGSGYGSFKSIEYPVAFDRQFPHKGSYEIVLWQAMRLDPLPGVRDVGLRIERAE
ncbi:MAG: gliding motility lipoprotein GldH [Bacteroidales bacterium]